MAHDRLTYRFAAEIRQAARNPYVDVPASLSDAFAVHAVAGRIRVAGTMEGVPVRATMMPVKGGGHRLYVSGGMRAGTGLAVGDTARFELHAEGEADVTVPPDVVAALGRHGEAFDALTPSHRRELLRYVQDARTPASRKRRVAELVSQVAPVSQVAAAPTEPPKPQKRPRRAAAADRPLWTCPECGNRFVSPNMYHSCARHTVDEALAGRPPEIRALFDRVRAIVEALGTVTLVAYRDRVAFMQQVRFAGATPRRRWLDVELWLTRRVDSPRMHKVETLHPRAHIHTVRLTAVEQLDDELTGWLAEAHAVGRREHLRSRDATGPGEGPLSAH